MVPSIRVQLLSEAYFQYINLISPRLYFFESHITLPIYITVTIMYISTHVYLYIYTHIYIYIYIYICVCVYVSDMRVVTLLERVVE